MQPRALSYPVSSPAPLPLLSIWRYRLEDSSLLAAAAHRPDTGDSLSMSGNGPAAAACNAWTGLPRALEFLLGHNIIAFDLPHLKALNPQLSHPETAGRGHPPPQPPGISRDTRITTW